MSPEIAPVAPQDARLAPLIDRHLTLMRASSPACSVHAMDAETLAEAGVRFFAILEGGAAVAMGGLKVVAPGHGELKSMHVAEAARGRGLARALLQHLLAEAKAAGMTRVSLETGVQDAFAAARGLYLAEGFEPCGPFGGYAPDPNSAFFSRDV